MHIGELKKMYFKNKNLHQFSVYVINTTFNFIGKLAGQLRYIPVWFSVGHVPAINSLSLSF